MNFLSTDGLSYYHGKIQDLLAEKVDIQQGKGLSSNDYTDNEKTKLAGFSSASDYALKSDIVTAMVYKGSVATYNLLPVSGNKVGDMYDVQDEGMNYAWNGSTWDAMGSYIAVTAITTSEIDAITG